jgi:threonine/homoserine efflux transporter RhtA
LLVLGVLSTGVAYALQAVAQQFTSASEAAVLTSAESVFGALGGMFLLAERPTLTTALGAGLIVLAILVIQFGASLLAAGFKPPSLSWLPSKGRFAADEGVEPPASLASRLVCSTTETR